MSHWSTLAPTVLAAFMASLVEFVEALTIILAVGIVRGWRSPLLGAASALLFWSPWWPSSAGLSQRFLYLGCNWSSERCF